jgi:ankyrin repeat protein
MRLICFLLDKGADIESTNNQGKTMAELASEAKCGIVLDKLTRVSKLRRSE